MQSAGFKDLDCDELTARKCRDNAGVIEKARKHDFRI